MQLTKIFITIICLFFNYAGFGQLTEIQPNKILPTSFAIIVDKETYNNCQTALMDYKNAVEEDGLSAYILANEWKNPDEVKKEILRLYNDKPPLEGVVFVELSKFKCSGLLP